MDTMLLEARAETKTTTKTVSRKDTVPVAIATKGRAGMSKRFKIEFSGKGYPAYRPISLKMNAPDKEQADEWVKRQLTAWNLKADIKYSIEEIALEPVKEEVKEKTPKKSKKSK